MKWTMIYLAGYFVFMVGVFAALSKLGILDRLGTGWTIIIAVIALGVGIMIAVTSGGEKKTVQIEKE